jgi:sulfoxide reductase heme-binding subunit YedZ
MTGRDPMDYAWWLASRASGLVALGLVALSVGIGLSMAGKAFRKPGLQRTLMAVHEHAALAGLVAIAVHGITLLGDSWLHPGPVGIAVPFAMDHEPLWTGLGIVAGYLAAALGLSFYFRRRIGVRRWRALHRATLLVYVLGVAHTLGAGTDAPTPWLQAMLVLTGAPILFLTVVRLLPAPAREPAPSAVRAGAAAPGAPPARG